MPTINGRELQHAIVDLQATCSATNAPPFQFKFFQSLKYKDGGKKKPVHNKEGKQVNYTIDKQETDASLKTLLSEWFRFRKWLRQQATILSAQMNQKIGVGQVEFELTVQYGAVPSSLTKDRLLTAMVQEEAKETSDNQDALACEIPLFNLGVVDGDSGDTFIAYNS